MRQTSRAAESRPRVPRPRPGARAPASGREPGCQYGRTTPRVVLVWGPAVVPAVLMLTVGWIRLDNPSLGWDENATWLVSRRTVRQIIDVAGNNDGVISPYYLFMHVWTRLFGDSELALRAPSLIAVAIGVGLAGELGRRLFGPCVGLVAGLILVAIPQLSRYAQDARAYGLAFMLATLATLLLYPALADGAWRRWVAYGCVITLLGLSHILGLLVLAGHAYAVGTRWWESRDRSLPRWLVVIAASLVPVLPFVLLGISQRGDQLDWIGPMRIGVALAAPGDVFGSAAAGLLVIGLALAVRWRGRAVYELAVLAAVPPAVLMGVSFGTASLWVPRYVLFVLPALALLAAASLTGLRLRTAAALLLLVAVSLPAHRAVRGAASHHGPNFRAASQIIYRQQQTGDGIVYGRTGRWSLRAGVDYHLRDRQAPRDLLLSLRAADVGALDAAQCPDVEACIGATRRVWFLRLWQSNDPLDDAGQAERMLREEYRQVGLWKVTKGTVALYERR